MITGVDAPQTTATDLMRDAKLRSARSAPQLLVRLDRGVGAGRRKPATHSVGPYIYCSGNKEAAPICRRRLPPHHRHLLLLCGLAAALAGVHFAGSSTKAYQSMSSPICLLPSLHRSGRDRGTTPGMSLPLSRHAFGRVLILLLPASCRSWTCPSGRQVTYASSSSCGCSFYGLGERSTELEIAPARRSRGAAILFMIVKGCGARLKTKVGVFAPAAPRRSPSQRDVPAGRLRLTVRTTKGRPQRDLSIATAAPETFSSPLTTALTAV